MRTQLAGRRAFDHQRFNAAVQAGHSAAMLANLRDTIGLALDSRYGEFVGILPMTLADVYGDDGQPIGKTFGQLNGLAIDAQPELVTSSNAGVPYYLTNWVDPRLIEVLVSPMKAALIAGETKKGDWTTNTVTFIAIESTGQVAAYGDYSNSGTADANTNFPQRQSFHYQVFTQWGEKELARAGLAGIDLASRKNIASALTLNKFQNQSYFFGIDGLQNYGLLNDPGLSAPIVPTVNWNSASADQVFADIVRLMQTLFSQANGLVDQEVSATFALSPSNSLNLNKTNQYNVNVLAQIKLNFPGIRIQTAPEYSTASGELVQLIVDEVEGQETVTAAFTEKMRAHAMVTESSSFRQKKSQGTWGTVIYRPVFIAQMLG